MKLIKISDTRLRSFKLHSVTNELIFRHFFRRARQASPFIVLTVRLEQPGATDCRRRVRAGWEGRQWESKVIIAEAESRYRLPRESLLAITMARPKRNAKTFAAHTSVHERYHSESSQKIVRTRGRRIGSDTNRTGFSRNSITVTCAAAGRSTSLRSHNLKSSFNVVRAW